MWTWLANLFAGPLVSALLGYVADYIKHLMEIFDINAAKKRQDDASEAIDSGDNEKLEKVIGDKDAGKPSGIGQLRPRRRK